VRRHLISDAPIGVFLSGGIDSSLISLCSSKFLGENLNTLSIIFDEEGYSEKKFQDIIHKQIGSKHSCFLLKEKDFLDSTENIFSAMDQPTIDGINTYFISKFARESGLKTVLSGIGGDELFGGYPSFNRINKIWYLNKVNKNFRKIFSVFDFIGNDKLKKLSYLSMKSPLNFYLLFRGIFNMRSICGILDLELNEVSNCIENLVLQNTDLSGSKNCVSFLESDIYMKNQLLRDTDFMSMSNSVEVRVPFLDQDLVRYVFSVDPKIKYKTDIQKFLLCNSFKDMIPKEIVNRKKQGFVFPFQIWIKNNIGFFTDMINDKNQAVQKTIDSFQNGNLNWPRFWSLVVLSQKTMI
ncbi:MAG: asparagine synthetase B family protein, partial [Thermodesulfobacteriota bacterium]